MCSFHLFPVSSLQATLCLPVNQTRWERASSDCLATSTTRQRTERREGAPLLSRGLRLPIILSACWQVGCHCVCLATQLPTSSPFSSPPSFSILLCYSLPCAQRKCLAPPSLKETGERERKVVAYPLTRQRLWFQHGAIYRSFTEVLSDRDSKNLI